MMNTRKLTMFPSHLFNQLDGDDQIYMHNLARSLLFIQNSGSFVQEKRDGKAVIAVKSAVPQGTANQEHDIGSVLDSASAPPMETVRHNPKGNK